MGAGSLYNRAMAKQNKVRDNVTWYWWGRIMLPATLVLVLVVSGFAYTQYQIRLQQTLATHQRTVSETASQLFIGLGRSLDLLVSMRSEQALADALFSEGNVVPLDTVFQGVIGRRRAVDQVRWIDQDGNERLRLQRLPDNSIVRVPDRDLQNKRDRSYFSASLGMDPSSLWISPIDLNEENGVVEEPILPTLRLMTPIRDPSGLSRGILIINERAHEYLELVSRLAVNKDHAYLVDQSGDYLVAPDSSKQWGRQLGHGGSFAVDNSAGWAAVQSADQGVVDTPAGYVAWQRVNTLEQQRRDVRLLAPDLTVMSVISRAQLAAMQSSVWRVWAIVGLLTWSALALGVHRWALLVDRNRRIRYENKLAEAARAERELAVARAAADAAEAHAQTLERSNRDLDNFAFVAAHDLRSPVRSIRTYVDLLGEDASNELSPAALEYVERLKSLSVDLDALLDGLVRYARVGRDESAPVNLALQPLIADLAAETLGDGFRVDIDAPGSVFVPRSVADSIFRQLLLNVVHHHPKGQGMVTVRSNVDGAYVTTTVTDDGGGIAPEHWDTVFGVFSTLSSQRRRPGLGLALIRRAVESQGGEVWIMHSGPSGTTVAVKLPTRASTSSARGAAGQQSGPVA